MHIRTIGNVLFKSQLIEYALSIFEKRVPFVAECSHFSDFWITLKEKSHKLRALSRVMFLLSFFFTNIYHTIWMYLVAVKAIVQVADLVFSPPSRIAVSAEFLIISKEH